jgi:outer membrane immunogenic protein
MKRLLLTGAAVIALAASAAQAADMPRKAILKAPPPIFTWTGFYFGLNAGGSLGRARTDWALSGTAFGTSSQKLDGFVGGIQEGYNWQFGNFVAGIETDFQGTTERGNASVGGAIVSSTSLPAFGTIRGRIGVTPVDHVLLYVTGGAAYGDIAFSGTAISGGLVGTAGSNTWHAGWTAGGGIEGAVDSNWSIRAEYLYVDLGSVTNVLTAPPVPASSPPIVAAGSTSVTDQIVRLGVNYRFGGSGPVAAKY